MKAKRAHKRLRRVEELLTNVIEKYDAQGNFHEFLETAKAAIAEAMTSLPQNGNKASAKSKKNRANGAAPAGKRPASAKAAAPGSSLRKAG